MGAGPIEALLERLATKVAELVPDRRGGPAYWLAIDSAGDLTVESCDFPEGGVGDWLRVQAGATGRSVALVAYVPDAGPQECLLAYVLAADGTDSDVRRATVGRGTEGIVVGPWEATV